MEFKIKNVYSAVDADELQPGTKAIFAENMEQLRHFVEKEIGIDTLDCVLDEGHAMRFLTVETRRPYALAYTVHDRITWRDLKVGDVITNDKVDSMVIHIDYTEDDDDLHILAGDNWLSDEDLEDYRKV